MLMGRHSVFTSELEFGSLITVICMQFQDYIFSFRSLVDIRKIFHYIKN